MSEPIWDEIVRSPLDPDPNEAPHRLVDMLPFVVVVGVGLLLGFFLGDEDVAPTPTTIASNVSATTTSAPPPPDPIVPPGYIESAGVGLRALAMFTSADGLFLVVNSAARSDRDPAATEEFHVAEWVLAGDGVERIASRAIAADTAPGVRLIEFPGVSGLPVSAPELRIRRATDMVVRTGCNNCGSISVDSAEGEVELGGTAVPFSLEDPLVIPVGTGISLSIDDLQLSDEWGFANWKVLDTNDARLRVDLAVILEGTDDPATDDVDPTQLVSFLRRDVTQQNPVAANPDPFTREGSLRLDRIGEIITADNQPEQLVLRWTVEWQHPVGETITLPLDGLVDLGSVD